MLTVQNLVKSFGDVHAVRNLSFSVAPGEIYGLLGPNGAGKTTAISMISGLLKPDQGQIIVDGAPFWDAPARAQCRMGVVPQEIALYEELDGRANLQFWGKMAGLSGRQAKARAEVLLDMLTLTDRADRAVKTYSGGMKRRINIGCALMHEPKLVLMDEPTVGIDPQARINILEFIKNLATQDVAVLYTTHYLEEAEQLCNRIAIIDQGTILAEGDLAKLQARLGGDALFVLDASLDDQARDSIVAQGFSLVRHSEDQLIVTAPADQEPAACLKKLLDLPFDIHNITLKKPTLNDVFIQLTGRALRE